MSSKQILMVSSTLVESGKLEDRFMDHLHIDEKRHYRDGVLIPGPSMDP